MKFEYALILGLVQGLTEFLPVSSSGHLVLLQHLLSFPVMPVAFDVFLHLGTLISVVIFFFKDIIKVIKTPKTWPIFIVASLPAVAVGGVLEGLGGSVVEKLFSSLLVVGVGFLVTSVLLWIRKTNWRGEASQLRWGGAFLIGLFQGVAVLPGISRSGATISGGLLVGLSREEAFRFSFILAIPAILGAAGMGILGDLGEVGEMKVEILVGVVVAGVVGLVALKLLKKVVIGGNLRWFAVYTTILGLICIGLAVGDSKVVLEVPSAICRDGACPVSTRKFKRLLKGVEIPPLTITSVFSSEHSWVKDLPEKRTVTLIATGDVGMVRTVNTRMIAHGVDYPFLKTTDLLQSGDITLVNLEGPLTKNCAPTDAGMVFCGRAENAEALVNSGVDVVSLANNHIMNYGQDGLDETVELLKRKAILPIIDVGAVETGYIPSLRLENIKTVKKTTFSFLAWDALSAIDEAAMTKEIKAVQAEDFLVCSFHWGDEYTLYPNSYQKRLAHLAIDSGCDLIIGNHPHWVQATEIYNGKFITYSHGNFIFDQMWSRETREGVVGKYTLYKGKLVDVEFVPILIEDYSQPRILSGQESEVILERMKTSSLTLE